MWGDALGPGSGTPAPDTHLPSRGCFRVLSMDARVGTLWAQMSVQQRRTCSFGSLPASPGFVHLCGASTPESLTLWDVSAVNALCLPKKGAWRLGGILASPSVVDTWKQLHDQHSRGRGL